MNNIDVITAKLPPPLTSCPISHIAFFFAFLSSQVVFFSSQHESRFLDVETKLSFLDLWLWERI